MQPREIQTLFGPFLCLTTLIYETSFQKTRKIFGFFIFSDPSRYTGYEKPINFYPLDEYIFRWIRLFNGLKKMKS